MSKLTLDVAVYSRDQVLMQEKLDNTKIAVRELLQRLKANYKCSRANSFFCAEDMGMYARFLLQGCHSKKLRVCMESALQIKKSLGILRGKNDALDSVRIAQYASTNFKTLRIWKPPRRIIEELKELSTLRRRLLKVKGMLTSIKGRQSYFFAKGYSKKLQDYSNATVSTIRKDIAKVDAEMDSLIAHDARLSRLVQLITSVPHIGRVIAHEMIIATNEFKDITMPKKFACYCGIAPFGWTSGTSLKGKSRVSHHANKQLKALLHVTTMGIARKGSKTFLKAYYDRKVAEGKNKMSVLNALRNKLVHRIFACVRDDKMFVELGQYGMPAALQAKQVS